MARQRAPAAGEVGREDQAEPTAFADLHHAVGEIQERLRLNLPVDDLLDRPALLGHEQAAGEFYRSERFFGRFERTIPLPFAVDAEKVEACYRDGVLTVTLPESENAKNRDTRIAIG